MDVMLLSDQENVIQNDRYSSDFDENVQINSQHFPADRLAF